MSYADRIFKENCREILTHGVWDTDQNVRPHWEDGTPAHTVKKFGIINRYDLREEFPILTIRRTYWKTAVDELLWYIYDRCRVMAIFGAMDDGALRQARLTALYDYARQLVQSGKAGLFDFITHLRRLLEKGDAPGLSAARSAEGVQIMSVHGSKGLEFPVVILADLQRSFNQQDMSRPVLVHPTLGLGTERVDMERHIRYKTISKTALALRLEREAKAEEMRILYVAMTRAKEKLTLTNARQRTLYGKTTPCMPSRFLSEIPENNMEWLSKPVPRSDAWEDSRDDDGCAYGYGGYTRQGTTAPTRREVPAASRPGSLHTARTAAKAPSTASYIQLQAGETVEHDAFGRGLVLSVRPMGGDALLEVAFDTVGTKKLMLKAASHHLKKV